MAIQTLQPNVLAGTIRAQINNNFSETTTTLSSVSAGVIPSVVSHLSSNPVFLSELEVGTGSPTCLYVEASNRVGINTETPNKDLTVFGEISASGTIEASNFLLKSPDGRTWALSVNNAGTLAVS